MGRFCEKSSEADPCQVRESVSCLQKGHTTLANVKPLNNAGFASGRFKTGKKWCATAAGKEK